VSRVGLELWCAGLTHVKRTHPPDFRNASGRGANDFHPVKTVKGAVVEEKAVGEPVIRAPSEELAFAGVNGGDGRPEVFVFACFDLYKEVNFALFGDEVYFAVSAGSGIPFKNAAPVQPQVARGPTFSPRTYVNLRTGVKAIPEVEEAKAEGEKRRHEGARGCN
jgi:hypothetical protein